MEEVVEYHNMSEAFDTVLRGSKRKRSRQGRFLLEHREEVIAELSATLGRRVLSGSGDTTRGTSRNTERDDASRYSP